MLVHKLDAQFPQPKALALDHAADIMAAIPSGRIVVIDGLALGGMPQLIEDHANRLLLVALIHHPLALETGLTRSMARRLATNESRALSVVDHIIVTSTTTARALVDDGIDQKRIGVVCPGTARRTSRAVGSANQVLTLLSVAAVIPRKGHLVLIEALSCVTDRLWCLKCVGSLERSPKTVSSVRAEIARRGMTDRVLLMGEVDEYGLHELYLSSDVFALASFWEGYGMAFSEALSYGLPIVATTAGAIPHTVGPGAGMLVAPGDTGALCRALTAVLDGSALRKRMADAAWSMGNSLPTWREASQLFSDELFKVSRL